MAVSSPRCALPAALLVPTGSYLPRLLLWLGAAGRPPQLLAPPPAACARFCGGWPLWKPVGCCCLR
jgi:hypothetical protein